MLVNWAVNDNTDSVLTNTRWLFLPTIIQLYHPKRKEMVYVQDGHS